MIVLCYPKCSTCKKALKWLEENNISYTYRDIAKENPTKEELTNWFQLSQLPLKRFFNTSGTLYKEMHLSQTLPTMNEEEQLALLSTNGMLVKRPIVVTEQGVLVGFKEKEWRTFFHFDER